MRWRKFSQTFLGSTVGSIEDPGKWITQQQQSYQELINLLKNKRETIPKDIERAKKDNLEFLQLQIKAVFKDAVDCIPEFAEDCWEDSESTMKREWKRKLRHIQFKERQQNAYETATNKFSNDLKESLEEIGKELQLIAQLNYNNFSFKSQDSFHTQQWMNLGAVVLVGIGVFFPPLAILGIAATVFVGLSKMFDLFKYREEKYHDAVAKISGDLNSQIEEQKKETLNLTKSKFCQGCDDISDAITQYFDELIQGLEAIASKLNLIVLLYKCLQKLRDKEVSWLVKWEAMKTLNNSINKQKLTYKNITNKQEKKSKIR